MKKINILEASHLLTGVQSSIYWQIYDLFEDSNFHFLSNEGTADKTVVFLDAAAINVLKNKGYKKFSEELGEHRIKIANEAYDFDEDVKEMYKNYLKTQKQALSTGSENWALRHYLMFTGLDEMEAVRLSYSFGLEFPVKFTEITLVHAEAVGHLGTDYEIEYDLNE